MIDIKQLRIGAHVEVNGVRRAVFGLGCGRVSYLPHPTSCVVLSVLASEINPIPITPELLVELGFVKRNRCDNNKTYYIDAASAEQMEKTRLVIPQIELLDYSEIGNPELWEVKILSTDNGFAVEHKITVSFLHNLEAFIFLTLGKELIEE